MEDSFVRVTKLRVLFGEKWYYISLKYDLNEVR